MSVDNKKTLLGIKPFQELIPCDDFIFSKVMRQTENVKPFLEGPLQTKKARVPKS